MISRMPRGCRLWDKGRGGDLRGKEEVICRKCEEAVL